MSNARRRSRVSTRAMTGFYLTLLAVLLAGFGARDQVTLAGLTAQAGARPSVLITACVVAIATAAFAAWGATLVAPMLLPKARLVLAAMALAFAGIEAMLIAPRRKPAEPTASLGALAIVLFAHQLTDAARFLVFAIAIAGSSPIGAGAGGAVGGMVLLAAAWTLPDFAGSRRARQVRRLIGLVLMLLAVVVALRAFEKL